MPVPITLSKAEVVTAALVGIERMLEAKSRGLRDAHGFVRGERSGLALHIEGACGELAVAKWLGWHWRGDVNTFKRADLGSNVQVRTRVRDSYDLIVRDDDADDDVFVHVTGESGDYRIHGWIRGHEARRPEYRRDYGGREAAFFVPAAALHAAALRSSE